MLLPWYGWGRNLREVGFAGSSFKHPRTFPESEIRGRQPQNRTARGGRVGLQCPLRPVFRPRPGDMPSECILPSLDPQHLAGIHLTPSSASGGGQWDPLHSVATQTKQALAVTGHFCSGLDALSEKDFISLSGWETHQISFSQCLNSVLVQGEGF